MRLYEPNISPRDLNIDLSDPEVQIDELGWVGRRD
jgi:hypothetical protein